MTAYRCFQAALFGLAALAIYGFSVTTCRVSIPVALSAAIIFVFTVTRPRFELLKLNAEPLYGFVATLCVWWIWA